MWLGCCMVTDWRVDVQRNIFAPGWCLASEWSLPTVNWRVWMAKPSSSHMGQGMFRTRFPTVDAPSFWRGSLMCPAWWQNVPSSATHPWPCSTSDTAWIWGGKAWYTRNPPCHCSGRLGPPCPCDDWLPAASTGLVQWRPPACCRHFVWFSDPAGSTNWTRTVASPLHVAGDHGALSAQQLCLAHVAGSEATRPKCWLTS